MRKMGWMVRRLGMEGVVRTQADQGMWVQRVTVGTDSRLRHCRSHQMPLKTPVLSSFQWHHPLTLPPSGPPSPLKPTARHAVNPVSLEAAL